MKTTVQALLAAAMLITLGAPTFAETTKAGFNVDVGTIVVDRRKKRIPGGSGCDDPRDVIEHPECRV